MAAMISALFDDRQHAERAVHNLLDIGVPREAITVLARDEHAHAGAQGDTDDHASGGAGSGALTGLGVGAGVGALFGLAALAIPGLGPFIAAGALAEVLGVTGGAVASGMILGGATGTLAGALARWGLSESEAEHYAGAVERGGIYVGVNPERSPVGREAIIDTLRRANGRVDEGAGTSGMPQAAQAGAATPGEQRIPLVEEVAQVQKVRHQSGEMSVSKRVETVTEHVSEPVIRAEVVTETHEVRAGEESGVDGRVVQLKPGETLRIQVVEEELVIQKVPRVTREVVIHARPDVQQIEHDVELRRERVEVNRVGDFDVDMPEDSEVVTTRSGNTSA